MKAEVKKEEEDKKAIEQEQKEAKLADVAKIITESKGKISLAQYENVIQHMFVLVQDLDSIPKNARFKVQILSLQ